MTVKSTNNADRERKAIFAGSFNPFTAGHASIVERGLNLFDRIYIVVGINSEKSATNAEESASFIRNLYNNEARIDVIVWKGLMVDLARQLGVNFFLRGVRNTVDFEYERNMADINREISGIETVFLSSLPQFNALSSSMLRELQSYGVNVDKWLPNK